MAKVGLLNTKYCKITETENPTTGIVTETLGTGRAFAKAIKANVSVKTSEAKMYANDSVAESVKEFISGTMTFESDDIPDEIDADVIGAGYDNTTHETVYTANDNAPYVRFGFVVRKIINKKTKFKAVVYMKVQFGIPNDEFETKGESIALKSTTISADVMRNKDYEWKRSQTFDTLAAADAYINPLVGIKAVV